MGVGAVPTAQTSFGDNAATARAIAEQAGILTRSHFESGKAVYELNEGTHHDHLVCLDCGKRFSYDAQEMRMGKRIIEVPKR